MYTHICVYVRYIYYACLHICASVFVYSQFSKLFSACKYVSLSLHRRLQSHGNSSGRIHFSIHLRCFIFLQSASHYYAFLRLFNFLPPPMKIGSPGRAVFFSVFFTIISPEPRIIADTDLIPKEHVLCKVYCGQHGGMSILLIVKQIPRLTCVGHTARK